MEVVGNKIGGKSKTNCYIYIYTHKGLKKMEKKFKKQNTEGSGGEVFRKNYFPVTVWFSPAPDAVLP